MEAWLLAVVIVVPVVCLTVLAAAIGFLCNRHWKRKRSQIGTTNTLQGYTNHGVQSNVDGVDVESQRKAQSNVNIDVESQRKASSHEEPETRIVNGNMSLVTVVDEGNIASSSAIGKQSDKRVSHVTINNEERVHQNFGTETIMDTLNMWRAIRINKERVQDNFQLGRNESIPAGESVSLSTSQQLKVNSNFNSTNVQNLSKAKSTYRPEVTPETTYVENVTKTSRSNFNIPIHRPAVTPDTKYAENFTMTSRSNLNTPTHRPVVKPKTRYVDNFKSTPKSNFNTSTGHQQLDLHYYRLNEAMAVFKNFLHESIAEYESSNYSRNTRFIEVITGRGLHSRGGIPVIKPAVEGYLIAHDHTYSWTNPGLVRIDLLPFREWDESNSD